MSFLNDIITYCNNASDFFYSMFLEANGWIYPFWHIATFFYSVCLIFNKLAWGFYYFSIWVNDAAAKLGQILSISAITSYFQTWIDYATSAWNWMQNAVNIITYNVTAWWSTTQQTVRVWIEDAKQWALAQINNLAGALAEVQTWWNSFKSKIPSLDAILLWFTNWWANILLNLQSWWVQQLLDVKSLFDSWLVDLAPVMTGWQEIRETVFNFFNNPLEWLLDKFTDWFLGVE